MGWIHCALDVTHDDALHLVCQILLWGGDLLKLLLMQKYLLLLLKELMLVNLLLSRLATFCHCHQQKGQTSRSVTSTASRGAGWEIWSSIKREEWSGVGLQNWLITIRESLVRTNVCNWYKPLLHDNWKKLVIQKIMNLLLKRIYTMIKNNNYLQEYKKFWKGVKLKMTSSGAWG